ncbi:glycosyltransferase [Clostridium sp. 'deep sea']|uniref:tetratricopeptide repeat-containing glycosyltransferase family 2 protein n=1 Tax=Clostridium sp. 'deep sea' TaxID=2779445 RepID=UPI00189650F2|nr:glycosyltransferase [Clostridium sp. 'deep sea']QOR36419.1 glycosyltransferase [Clostridium sp. 'deep sea']
MNKPSVALCMIVKNEEDYLAECLNSVKNYVDEVVIVDTGSTDKTIEIAKHYKVKLIESIWQGNFSKARNLAINNAKCDWILILDADERLEQVAIKKWQALLNNNYVDGYNFKVIDYLGDKQGQSYVSGTSLRLFRNKPQYRYQRRIHEQIEKSIITNSKKTTPCVFSEVIIYHYGYLAETIKKKNKTERNISLLQAEVELNGDAYSHYNLGAEYLRIADYQKAVTNFNMCLQSPNYKLGYMAECHKKMALSLYLMGTYKQSLLFLQDSIKIYPDYTDLYFLASEVLYTLGEFELASNYLKKCLQLGDVYKHTYTSLKGVGSFRAFYRLGLIAEEQNKTELALGYYHDSLKINPSFIYVIKALINLVANTVPEAEFVNKLLVYINFMNEVDKYNIAFLACTQIGYYTEALKMFNYATKAGLVLNGKIALNVSLASLLARDYSTVQQYLNIALKSNNADTLMIIRIMLVLGFFKQDQNMIKNIITLQNKSVKEYIELYRALNELFFNNVNTEIDLTDNYIAECLEIFNMFICSNQIAYLKLLLPIFSSLRNMDVWVKLSRFYINNKQYKLAVLELLDCHKRGHKTAESFYLLGLAYSSLGLLHEAMCNTQQSIKLCRDLKTIKLLSEIYNKMSDAVLFEGLKRFPESQELHNKISGRRL